MARSDDGRERGAQALQDRPRQTKAAPARAASEPAPRMVYNESWRGPSTPEEKRAYKEFVAHGLPVELPCNAPSYLVATAEAGRNGPEAIGFLTALGQTDVYTDFLKVLVLIMTQLVALYAASFNFAGMESRGLGLSLFAAGYLLLMMALLFTRSNDMSLRKESYYLLLKYKCLMDWNNWGWTSAAKYRIYQHSFFFWFWLVTASTMFVYAIINNNQFQDECNSKMSFMIVVVVMLQLFALFMYFYSTLMVESSGIITFNKFFENKEGILGPEAVERFIDAGPLRSNPIVILQEDYVKEWAVARFSALPTPHIPYLHDNPNYDRQLAQWQQEVEGDLQALHGHMEPGWQEPDNWILKWTYSCIWGFCLIRVLMRHPDFKAMHVSLKWLSDINTWKVLLSMVWIMSMEIYACVLIFGAILSM